MNYEDLGFAKIDHDRKARNGYPEVIYGEGKTPAQAATIFARLAEKNSTVLSTRTDKDMATAIMELVPDAKYHENCRVVILQRDKQENIGCVAIATGGTSDIPVAEEAAVVLEAFGSKVLRLYDVGVAGIHRLLDNADMLQQANCVIAVAGMEGALPSVVGGLVKVPVIAVPTSVGYGANFGGVTALLAMLNSCAAGVSVVNIGNGFGAAYQADMINKMAVRGNLNNE
jgi:NCAIR mutase (PurE)-related protein